MTRVTWASVYCRIPASQHKRVTVIARQEFGGKLGRYVAHVIKADLDRRTRAAKAKKGTPTT